MVDLFHLFKGGDGFLPGSVFSLDGSTAQGTKITNF